MLENAPLQLAQLDPRLQSELVAQVVAGRGVELKRFRLAPAAVEGEHCLRLHTLARAVLGCEACQLRQELRVAAERQLRLGPLLERDQAELIEPLRLRTGKLLVRDLAVGPSAPKPERTAKERGCEQGISLARGRSPIGHELLEACGV